MSSFGVSGKIDGTHIGTEVAPLLKEFYKDKSVDLSSPLDGLAIITCGGDEMLYGRKGQAMNWCVLSVPAPVLPFPDSHCR